MGVIYAWEAEPHRVSNNRLELNLAEFRAALRNLPKELAAEAAPVVDHATEVTAASLFQSYPLGGTGNLRKGVKHSVERSAFGVIGTVKSTSPHAHLWEFGTQNRRTRQGWRRGAAPAHYDRGLVGIATRWRRRMNEQLIGIVKRAGFQVSGAL
jgi:Bacteriophage HK97-gp10, putative tail-component